MEVNAISEDFVLENVKIKEESPLTQLVMETVKDFFESFEDQPEIKLDPARVTNAISFLVEQVETIQLAEKIFVASQITGQDNGVIKDLLLQMKERPDGFAVMVVMTGLFTDMVDKGNIEIMDFILAEFGNHLDLDDCDVAEATTAYIVAGEENKAIQMLDRMEGEGSAWDLKDLLSLAVDSKMSNLSSEIRERLAVLNRFDVAL